MKDIYIGVIESKNRFTDTITKNELDSYLLNKNYKSICLDKDSYIFISNELYSTNDPDDIHLLATNIVQISNYLIKKSHVFISKN